MEGGGGSGLSEDRKGGNGAISAAGRLRVVINWLPPPPRFSRTGKRRKRGNKKTKKGPQDDIALSFLPLRRREQENNQQKQEKWKTKLGLFSASKGGFSTSLFLSYFPFSPMLESGGLPPFFFPSLHFRKGGQKTIFLKRKEKEGGRDPRRRRRRRSHLPKKKSQPT